MALTPSALAPPSSPLQHTSPSSPYNSHALHGCLAIKALATFSQSLANSNSSSSSSSSSSLAAKSFTVPAPNWSDEECVVGPFCPLFSSRKGINFSWNSQLSHARIRFAAAPVGLTRGQFASTTSLRRRLNPSVRAANQNSNGASFSLDEKLDEKVRFGEVVRTTKETNVAVSLNLDGSGVCDCNTGIPFLDHMLDQLSSHGLFDLHVKAKGDLHIDDHHTNEDVALALGTAFLQALGDRKGIHRFGDFSAPLDEALVHVVLDLSGRPYLGYNLYIPSERVGTFDTQLVEHFFQSFVNTSGTTLHIHQLSGKNSHHIIEATFKAFAKALRRATEYDERRKESIPSSKGLLSRA